jgi:hypothetical protein
MSSNAFRLLVLIAYIWECLSAATKRRKGKDMKKPLETIEEAGYALLLMLSFLIIPVLVYFVYVIWKDPVTPHLIEDLIAYTKEKSFGYLSDIGIKIDRKSQKKEI